MSGTEDRDEAPELPRRAPGGMRGPMMGGAMPVAKAMDFRGSGRRLLGILRPERARVSLVMTLAVASVSLVVLGPDQGLQPTPRVRIGGVNRVEVEPSTPDDVRNLLWHRDVTGGDARQGQWALGRPDPAVDA